MQNTSNQKWVKLSQIQGFTFQGVKEVMYKQWDPTTKQMNTSKTPVKGFRKMYTCITSEGLIDLSQGQIGQILEACFGQRLAAEPISDLTGAKIKVANNGQTGMDIRYFFNFAGYEEKTISYDEPSFGNEEEVPFPEF